MPLPAPPIDDRTFAQIVAEARTRIPRYTPEWTDLNDSDPGITLVQLFAWLTEITLYRLNRVPELHYVKFLELIGTKLQPASPAVAELTFTLVPGSRDVVIPKGTQVAAAGSDGEPVLFETDTALATVPAPLAELQVYDGFSYSIVTGMNAAGRPFEAFGPHRRDGSALLLGFDEPADFTSGPVDLAVVVHTEEQLAEGRHCDIDLGAVPLPASLAWEYWNRERRTWLPLEVERDETRAFTRSGHVTLRGPGAALRRDEIGDVPVELAWIRCLLVRGAYESAPKLQMVLANTVPATQATTVRNEILGGTDGRENQSFFMSSTPVVPLERAKLDSRLAGTDDRVKVVSVRLEVDEGSGFEIWQEVEDFYESKSGDAHFTLDRASGEIRFGNGRRGRIPVANPDNPAANVIAREYRAGGGSRGNVAADAITELQTSVDGIDTVRNARPAEGGKDEETLEEAKDRAARELRNRSRAVTADDFESLARDTPMARVKRAKAIPLRHPRFPGASVPGVVTVVVVPDGDTSSPTPNEATLRAVCAHLNAHRLLTSEVHVVPPTYREVVVQADLVAEPDADLAEVKRMADKRLRDYFHPLEGGEEGRGWPFGGDISFSRLYRQVLDVPGVARIRRSELFIVLDGERQPFCRDVPLEGAVLLFSGDHGITVGYGFDE